MSRQPMRDLRRRQRRRRKVRHLKARLAETSAVTTLYVVGVAADAPEDMSPRARRILQEVALILTDEGEAAGRLLEQQAISTPLLALTDAQSTADLLPAGDAALLFCHGAPGPSERGRALVRAALQAGMAVVPIPGPALAPSRPWSSRACRPRALSIWTNCRRTPLRGNNWWHLSPPSTVPWCSSHSPRAWQECWTTCTLPGAIGLWSWRPRRRGRGVWSGEADWPKQC